MHKNNLILGDFNFVDNDLDKGKGMDQKDKAVDSYWNNFKDKRNLVDPFRIKYPRKKLYSYVASAGKSRCDRLYINEENEEIIINIRYIPTPFNSAHRILTFEIKQTQEIRPGYWKMNSSILQDKLYKKEIERIVNEIRQIHLRNPKEWWDLFILMTRSITIKYSKQKAEIRKQYKKAILYQIQKLEAIPTEQMTHKEK